MHSKAVVKTGETHTPLKEVKTRLALEQNTYFKKGRETLVCFDLAKGKSTIAEA